MLNRGGAGGFARPSLILADGYDDERKFAKRSLVGAHVRFNENIECRSPPAVPLSTVESAESEELKDAYNVAAG